MANAVSNKKEFKLEQVFAMWKRKSEKTGKPYFTGKDQNGVDLVGFYNGMKQNPKEPDVRIYHRDDLKKEYCSLWSNVSENGKKYLSGKVDGKRVVGFINDTENTKRPYFAVYFSDEGLKKTDKQEHKKKDEVVVVDELPF